MNLSIGFSSGSFSVCLIGCLDRNILSGVYGSIVSVSMSYIPPVIGILFSSQPILSLEMYVCRLIDSFVSLTKCVLQSSPHSL